MSDVSQRLLNTIAEALQVSPAELTAESGSNDIENWDSMGTMNILLSLESEFGLRLAPGQTSQLQSVQGIVELLKKAGKLE